MITDIQLSTLILIAAVIWGILLILKGTPLSIKLFDPFSNVTGVLVVILGLFDKWGWKWKIFYPWLVSTPYLQGTWKGQLISDWIDPETNKQVAPIDVYLVIKQSFSSLHARLLTKESSSELLSGEVIKNTDATWSVVGIYRNIPKLLIRDRSPMHHGGIILMVKGKTPIGLEGQFWTDRGTKGELYLSGYNKKTFYDYGTAAIAEYTRNIDKSILR
jgi:hypothetical protein